MQTHAIRGPLHRGSTVPALYILSPDTCDSGSSDLGIRLQLHLTVARADADNTQDLAVGLAGVFLSPRHPNK